jgi:SpoVK/Ycf46/Vps4 family AAA+-type ATPase
MANSEHLLMLFRAFRDRNEAGFQRIAESIISDELAANHHALAREMQKVLEEPKNSRPIPIRPNGLASLPRDRRSGEELITYEEARMDPERLILCERTRKQVARIIDEHRNRTRLAKHGLQPKTKILFWGPPGCGKTLTAHFVAQEMSLPLGLVRLNALISSFLGDTASHIQRVFDLGKSTPMVLLLDEVDAIAKNRDDPNDVGELKRVVNSLLQAMDSFQPAEGLAIAASNHQYLLDPAIWRRFDDVIFFPPPTARERELLLHRLLNGIEHEVPLAALVKKTSSLSFADIERVVTESIKTVVLENRESLHNSDVLEQLKNYRDSITAAKTKSTRQADE